MLLGAYRTPDFGIWERGDKSNHGEPELNSSSIGMAYAALRAINGVNLFGARGSSSSVTYVIMINCNTDLTEFSYRQFMYYPTK